MTAFNYIYDSDESSGPWPALLDAFSPIQFFQNATFSCYYMLYI